MPFNIHQVAVLLAMDQSQESASKKAIAVAVSRDAQIIGIAQDDTDSPDVPRSEIINLIQNLSDEHINRIDFIATSTPLADPANSVLYTTLRPCYMCAGMLAQASPSLRIVYDQADSGMGGTALNPSGQAARESQHSTLIGDKANLFRSNKGFDQGNASFVDTDAEFLKALSQAYVYYLHEGKGYYVDGLAAEHRKGKAVFENGVRLIHSIEPSIATLIKDKYPRMSIAGLTD